MGSIDQIDLQVLHRANGVVVGVLDGLGCAITGTYARKLSRIDRLENITLFLLLDVSNTRSGYVGCGIKTVM